MADVGASQPARDTTAQSDVTKYRVESDGSFKRPSAIFRDNIEVGGRFEPEAGRYHLYVSYACPWAQRTLIVSRLKGLESMIGITVVSPRLGKDGWPFADVDPFPGAQADELNHAHHIKDLYLSVDPDHSARFSVPVLWDKKNKTIVNNESSEIIRMLNSAFNNLLPDEFSHLDLYPQGLRVDIDAINDWVYNTINNGVYKAGVANTQEAYSTAVQAVFQSLTRVEDILNDHDFLVSDLLTEADVRLFVTIVRFDVVYYTLFKCNVTTIRDGFPAIHRWLRRLYWGNVAFGSTTNFDHIKTHYFWSLAQINPARIIPIGPVPHVLPLDSEASR